MNLAAGDIAIAGPAVVVVVVMATTASDGFNRPDAPQERETDDHDHRHAEQPAYRQRGRKRAMTDRIALRLEAREVIEGESSSGI
jgi:hypothetical protein